MRGKLRQFRVNAGMTQTQAAQKAGVPPNISAGSPGQRNSRR